MTAHLNVAHLLRNLLAALTALACGAAPAVGQNVIRGTSPGWPGNTAYYAPQTAYQYAPVQAGVVQAQYAPQPGVTAYYAPASAARIAYAVPATGSYQVSYAGANQPGLATAAYYGGYTAPVRRVVYMPQQQVYYAPQVVAASTQAAAAPVTYYRVYQPAAVAPATTCGHAACQPAQSCGSSCGSGWSLWRPFAWMWGGSSCCSKPATCNYGGCGSAQPYYVAPVAPVIPTAPAPIGNPLIRGPLVPSTTIPAPATRSGPVITTEPANIAPALPFRSTVPSTSPPFSSPPTPAPGGFTPGPAPFTPAPGAFRPVIEDPYSQPVPSNGAPPLIAPPAPSGSQIMGSGYSNDRTQLTPQNQPSTISEPGFNSPPPNVQPLRDPHGDERKPQDNNRAPQLLTPGDRTANSANRWAVIPAVWPVKSVEARRVAKFDEPLVPVVQPTRLDDGGWKSAR